MPPHLLVALTPHGFGHAAMTAPVVNKLRRQLPELRLTLQTAIPRPWLEGRYRGPFDLIPDIPDFGLRMHSALGVSAEDTWRDYKSLHDRLDIVVEEEAARMRAVGADLLLSNIPYVSLLAAARIGLSAVAMSCLNWADLFGAFCRDLPGGAAMEAEILAAYRAVPLFLRPEPAMPMPRLSNTRAIGPIGIRGQFQPERLRQLLGVGADTRIGLITFGGMDSGLSFRGWPRLPGWVWVTTADPAGHPGLVARERLDMPFTDILRSCDMVVGKPGYGTFTEAAINGIPMLYLPRLDWPESPGLDDWLAVQGRCRQVSIAQLFDAASLQQQLQALFSLPNKPLTEPSGVAEAAREILPMLCGTSANQCS